MMSERSEAPLDSRTRVLMIDDDTKLCRLVRDYLEPLGYEVSSAHTGPSGLCSAESVRGRFAGPDASRHGWVRGVAAAAHAVECAGTDGADDYLPKTFSNRELLARLRAVIRRSLLTAAAQANTTGAPALIVSKKLRDDPKTPKFIVTVRSLGYMMRKPGVGPAEAELS